jgi:hypothetical protein
VITARDTAYVEVNDGDKHETVVPLDHDVVEHSTVIILAEGVGL